MRRMRSGNSGVRLVAAVAVVGALAGFAVSYRVTPAYVSSATISVTPVVDPARPVSAEVAQEHVAQCVEEMQTDVMSRAKLAAVIDDSRLRLYETERRTTSLENVIDEMRRDIRIETVSSTKRGLASMVFSISFAYPDAPKAQATAGTLAGKFIEANLNRGLAQQKVYRPRPPVGEVAALLSAASLPVKAEPNRFVFVGWGLAIGIAMGLMAAETIRWPRFVRRIAAFGAAACALALPASFLIPNRYTSTAVMQIEPAALMDDGAAPTLPPDFIHVCRQG